MSDAITRLAALTGAEMLNGGHVEQWAPRLNDMAAAATFAAEKASEAGAAAGEAAQSAAAAAAGYIRRATLAELEAVTALPGSGDPLPENTGGEVTDDGNNTGQYRWGGEAWVKLLGETVGTLATKYTEQDARLTSTSRTTEQIASTHGRFGPGYERLAQVTTDNRGIVAVADDGGEKLLIGDKLRLTRAVLDRLWRAAGGRQGPGFERYSHVTVGSDGRVVEAWSEDDGRVVAINGRLRSAIDILEAADQATPRVGPGYLRYASVELDEDSALVGGRLTTGETMVIGPDRVPVDAASGAATSTGTTYSWAMSTSIQRSMPTADVDVFFAGLGQSHMAGVIDEAHLEAATVYNGAISGALMPSPGLFPSDASFTTYAPLQSVKGHLAESCVEQLFPQMAKTIIDDWTARGFSVRPRIICAAVADGGQPLQRFMRGSTYYSRLLAILKQCRAISAQQGKRLIVYGLVWMQGQANRWGSYESTRHEYAALMLDLQTQFEADVRRITGQSEPVPMITAPVQRAGDEEDTVGRGNEVTMGQILAADADPSRVILSNPDYALEFHSSGPHPSVAGYRRMGWHVGRAALLRIFGANRRTVRVVKYWMHSDTEMRLEIERPRGADLVVDDSDDLVATAYMDAGCGFRATDKDGVVAITDVSVLDKEDLHDAAFSGGLAITFESAPHLPSLRVRYALDSVDIGGTLGGRRGPRGLIRADDGESITLSDLTAPMNSWLMPWETN